ncbi:hypothetical protein LOS78_05740 [Paracoccus sp. MA]|uniref:hypothetical protein n=1 Tax=Paracoccus sp. MA TaxID=2895796 RepID=UPI001E370065|nr:hypothetical protein [Paracoccus sp. MA]UFM63667.1 hypothetical protein LOS78_05740 [Paracoccus sp. MA]
MTKSQHGGPPRAPIETADLCASGQVRALTRAAGDESKAGWIISFDDLQAIRAAAGDWGYGIDLEAVEAIALEVERRILAALTPAPQAATPTAQEAGPVAWWDAIAPALTFPADWRDQAGSLNKQRIWANGFQTCREQVTVRIGELEGHAHPPQPSQPVTEAATVILNTQIHPSSVNWQSVWDAMREDAKEGDLPMAFNKALRALKGGE